MASVTISSAGFSDAITLDYIGAKTTSITAFFGSSTSSAAYNLQGTFDSPMRSSSPSWFFLSTTTWTASTNFDLPTMLQITTPLAGARLLSTGLSSSTITLRTLQNAGG